MKKGCLLVIFGTIAFLVLLIVIGIIWAFVSPEAKEIAKAQEQESKRRAEAKVAETEKSTPAELETKSLSKAEPPSPKQEKKPESKTDSAALIAEARKLYSQLREMRHSASFHELGFSGPNHEWFKSFKTLQEKVNGNTELIVKGVVVGDLYTIGQEWMRNKGADTEVSKTLAAQLNEAFGIEEKEKQKVATIFDLRTWRSADGQRAFLGALTKLGDGELTVEKDGKPITFAIAKLSPADREFLGQGVSITTLDGKTYKTGSVAQISAESILFKNDSGPVQIAMENLPEEMRQRFGYDPEIAAKMKEGREKQAAALRERQAEGAAQQTAQNKLESFMAVLKAVGVGNETISHISTEGATMTLTVANSWHYEPKQVRQQNAQILWQAWAMIYSPNDLDKARLDLRDSVGNKIGGSRFLGGSLIWVDD